MPVEQARPTPYEEALALFEQGRYLEAEEKLKADFAPPHTAESWALLARICANLGELTEARSWAEKALGADKLNAGLHYLRSVILQEQGDTEERIAALKRALYLDPNFVLAHFALGNFALQQRNFKEADKHFSNVLGLLADYQPDDVLPQSDGLVAGRLKEMVESAIAMEKAA
jgi:chemotaxis protein methyltransferase CheR